MNSRLGLLAASFLLVFASSGCAAAQGPIVAPDRGVDIDRDVLLTQQRDFAWNAAVDIAPDIERPDVQIVRLVSFAEWGEAQANCMQVAGFDATANPGSVDYGPVSAGLVPAWALARYTCEASYPLDPAYQQPLTEVQIQSIYDYYVDELMPCLRGEGFDPPAAPSKISFVETYGSPATWTPYAIFADPTVDANFDELEANCPQFPDGFF